MKKKDIIELVFSIFYLLGIISVTILFFMSAYKNGVLSTTTLAIAIVMIIYNYVWEMGKIKQMQSEIEKLKSESGKIY